MRKKSKRYKTAAGLVTKGKSYSVAEAVELIKKMPPVKFDETLEVNGSLGIDPKQTDQAVRGSVVLPNGTGKTIKIVVFCESDKENDAKTAGADFTGGQDLVEKIVGENWTDFDYCIATPGMMRVVSKLGKMLGPRGLMPSPKNGTVTENIAYAVKEAKRGKVDFRMDKQSCVHVGVGKISFTKEQLGGNVDAVLEALLAARPAGLKGDYIKGLYLASTMGPALRIAVQQSVPTE